MKINIKGDLNNRIKDLADTALERNFNVLNDNLRIMSDEPIINIWVSNSPPPDNSYTCWWRTANTGNIMVAIDNIEKDINKYNIDFIVLDSLETNDSLPNLHIVLGKENILHTFNSHYDLEMYILDRMKRQTEWQE
jgi:hypothetical protein